MKTYCMSCGEAVEFTIKQPKTCPFCSQDIIMKKEASSPKDKPKKNSIDADELEEFFQERERKKSRLFKQREEEDYEDDLTSEDNDKLEEKDDDDDEEEEKPKRNKRSKASFVDDENGINEMKNMFGFSAPQRIRGDKIANIAVNKAEVLPPRNAGKKMSKKQILAEFQRQAASKTPVIEVK